MINKKATAFNWFGIKKFEDRIVDLNANDTSVKMGQYKGMRKLIKGKTPWLELLHFSVSIELALKDAFDTSPFGKVDNMLIKLY